jgi:hypothetical protein
MLSFVVWYHPSHTSTSSGVAVRFDIPWCEKPINRSGINVGIPVQVSFPVLVNSTMDVLPEDDIDMDESILVSYKEDIDELVKDSDTDAIATFEQGGGAIQKPTTSTGICRRCGIVGVKQTICYNCISYYETDMDDEESETDSQVAEQLVEQYCSSPVKGSPNNDDDDDYIDDESNDSDNENDEYDTK